MMKIGYLGSGAWGVTLASLLASKGHQVVVWSIFPDLVKELNTTRRHPKLDTPLDNGDLTFTTSLEEVLVGIEMLVESVTGEGMRPVFKQVNEFTTPSYPIVLTSKGIEQNTGLILSDVVAEVLGEEVRTLLGAISGPSYATDVIKGLPTSVVGSSYDSQTMETICKTFTTDTFRVYPNPDMRGVAYGGALKNVIAIACGIAEGLALGDSARAALMTRGLHEIRKPATALGCVPDTLCGLSGMGDICLTCSSLTSRNFRFGYLISQGKSAEEARKEIGMVVEGAYTAVSALQLSKKHRIPMPITETVYEIIYQNLPIKEAVKGLMQREIKEELL